MKISLNKIKIKLNEIAYPLNFKNTFLHFLIIIVYVFGIRNGIAYCMITEDDITNIDHAINQVNGAISQSMEKITTQIKKDIAHLSEEKKQPIILVIDNLFGIIKTKYSAIRSFIVNEGSNGIITAGPHQGKYFMNVIAENDKHWLRVKNQPYYHKLCLLYAQNVAEKLQIEVDLIEIKAKLIEGKDLIFNLEKIRNLEKYTIEKLEKQLENKKAEHGAVLAKKDAEYQAELAKKDTEYQKRLAVKNLQFMAKSAQQKDLGNRWLKIQVEKNNLINQGHYQFMAMGAMGMGIAVTGGYLLYKCI